MTGSKPVALPLGDTPTEYLNFLWLGCQDSNLGMAESESAALPLGDTPKMVAMTGFEPVTPAL
jgi:hypothetical protein